MMFVATTTVETWQILVPLLAAWALKFLQEFYKDRRERKSELEKLNVLQSIAQSNVEIREGQIKQNGKLSQVVAVNNAHHNELIGAVRTSCKSDCRQLVAATIAAMVANVNQTQKAVTEIHKNTVATEGLTKTIDKKLV